MKEKAIVLLSGGIDSQTCLAIAQKEGYSCYALAIDYGQKNITELKAANRIATASQCEGFRRVKVEIGEMPGAALTDINEPIPEYTQDDGVKTTYFPARNTIFLSLALAWAESIKASRIFIGINQADYHGFPDARIEYLEAFNQLAQLATSVTTFGDYSIKVEAPLINCDKAGIIKKGLELGVDYSLSITCYQADEHGLACGYCDSCIIRKNAFNLLEVIDPTSYQINSK